MKTPLQTALFAAESVAHLRGYEREILPLADLARGQAQRIAELEDALRSCVNIAAHPQSTKADMRHIAKDGAQVLARTVEPLAAEMLNPSAREEANHNQAMVAAFGEHGQG